MLTFNRGTVKPRQLNVHKTISKKTACAAMITN